MGVTKETKDMQERSGLPDHSFYETPSKFVAKTGLWARLMRWLGRDPKLDVKQVRSVHRKESCPRCMIEARRAQRKRPRFENEKGVKPE